MRSSSIISAWATVAALAAGCRTPPGAPARPGGPGAAGEETTRPSGVHTRASFSLGNGLRVVLEENHAAPAVAAQVWIGAGAADDAPGQEGTANVVQHVLERSAAADAGAQSAGARAAAWASYDQTVVHCLIASPYFHDGLRALAGAVMQPGLSPADFEAARGAARDDLRAARTDPQRVAAAAALAAAFTTHPYRRPLLGTEASLGALTLDQLRASYARAFGAANATLVVVGDFDPVAARSAVTTLFGAWEKGDRPAARAAEPAQQAPRVVVSSGDLGNPELAVAWKTPDVRGEDRAGLEILAALLGRGGRTRLEDELVRNRQLAFDARAFLFAPRDPGVLFVTATLAGSGAVEAAASAISDEAARLVREGPTAEELARARTAVEREEVAQKAGLGGYAGRLGMYTAVAGDPDLEVAHLRRLRAIEPGDVKEVAARYLRTSGMTVSAVLPTTRSARGSERAAALVERLRAQVASADANRRVPAPAAPRAAAARNDVVVATLPSGVRVVVLPEDGSDEVAVRAVWPGGVRREEGRLAGAGALTARLLARRTKTRSADQIAAELANLGGRLEGFAGLDLLGVQGDFLGARWERGLELVVDCLRNPRFADEDVEQDRRVLLDEIRKRLDDPAAAARRLFDEALFGRHPYHQDVLGNVESVAMLTRRRLLDHFRANYGPRGLTIAVVGGVAADRVIEKLATLFEDAPVAPSPASPSAATPVPSVPAAADPREVVRFAPTGTAQIVLGYPGVGLADPDRLALDVLGEILGGPGHRLAAALHDRRGLIQGVTARSLVGVDPGAFSVQAVARPAEVEAAVAALRAELAGLVQSGVTADEVVVACRSLVGRRALALAARGALASALAVDAALGVSGRSPRRDTDDLSKIRADDVTRVARRILDSRREVLAVVRPRLEGRATPVGRPGTAR